MNQSGFDWVKLLERVQMISQKEKFDKHSILIDKWNDINLSSQDGSIFLEVLKYSYRNPQSIVSFNRSAFRITIMHLSQSLIQRKQRNLRG